jgi:hypothetical protein
MIDYDKRIEELRSVEVYCYSLCVHLLKEEPIAAGAAKSVLIELYEDEQFWSLQGEERQIRVRDKTISKSVQAYRESLT